MMTPPDPQALFDQLWAANYAPRHRELRRAEEERRAEAFVEDARRIGPGDLEWHVRVMTPYDALFFDAADSPFVAVGAADCTPDHLGWALWHLRADARPRLFPAWRQGRQIWRWRRRWLDRLGRVSPAYQRGLAAFLAYMKSMFADSALPRVFRREATGETPRPAPMGTHWMADLLVSLSCEMGTLDPIGQRPWAHVPLPQIWQYRRELHARETREPVRDGGEAAALRAECLAEVQRLLTARRQAPAQS